MYVTGNITPYFKSYLSQFQKISNTDMFLLLSLSIIWATILFPLGSYISKRTHPRLMILIGCGIAIALMIGASYTTDFMSFLVLYTLSFGFSNGITSALVNPDNIDPDSKGIYPPEVANNVPFMLQMLSAIWGGIALISTIMTFGPPEQVDASSQIIINIQTAIRTEPSNSFPLMNNLEEVDVEPQIEVLEAKELRKLSIQLREVNVPSLGKCLTSIQFLSIYFMNFMSICKFALALLNLVVGMFFMSTYRNFAAGILKDDQFITLVGSLGGFASSIRFVWQPLIAYFGYKKVYGSILILQIGIAFSFAYIVSIKALFLIYICLIFWCEGAHYTLVPIIIANHFGAQATMVYAYAFSFGGFSQLISSALEIFLLDELQINGFYYLGGVLSFCSLFILIAIFKDKKFC
ncbi:UNKNOWN [Stylonychia lemnae]|uniref:Major facilitator superfamily protein n=1 Tax=Stylonychia lemnae TaxID=5949 RepID=A0A078AIP9_STYLE|nr:UNKNOWN [Stylonychia lemnae]|eukprot:CDW82145.1 UNKNOWN [Stylonychia lemnae]